MFDDIHFYISLILCICVYLDDQNTKIVLSSSFLFYFSTIYLFEILLVICRTCKQSIPEIENLFDGYENKIETNIFIFYKKYSKKKKKTTVL